MERLALDTTFLIDLQNERRSRGAARGAIAFLEAHPDVEVLLPAVALGEYLEGFDDPDGPDARGLVASLRLLDVTPEVARVYAGAARALRSSGRLIGTNDLWIGCTALASGLPLLTRNVEHFRRIPRLEVVAYADR
ncbi:MAG: type II toxin-antitoxin system VapC family toxin [Myxococcales bacterium]|nr:type II toxin-antitoxin system VapC family toxin [Myxococcales bacterium]